MKDATRQKSTRPDSKRVFAWALGLMAVGILVACGGRVGKFDIPVGLTVLVHPVEREAVKPFDETYPHTALQISSEGRTLSFDEDFELVLLKDPSGNEVLARYKGSDLAAATKETRCAAGLATMASDKKALFCGQSMPIAKAGMFLLLRPDGSVKVASSYTSVDLDQDLGVRHLSLSF